MGRYNADLGVDVYAIALRIDNKARNIKYFDIPEEFILFS